VGNRKFQDNFNNLNSVDEDFVPSSPSEGNFSPDSDDKNGFLGKYIQSRLFWAELSNSIGLK